MWQWWQRWGIAVLSLAWLVQELWFALDGDPRTRPLTYVIVEELPPALYLPLAAALAHWIVPHLYHAGQNVARGIANKKAGTAHVQD